MAKRSGKQGDPKIAIGYLRVSTEEQQLGPDAQRASIEGWAAQHGVAVVAWYVDQGVSGGAPVDKRPGLLEALAALREHGAGILVVAKRDRLARDVMVAAMIESLAKRAGARVVSAAGEGSSEDENDPSALLMRRLVDAFAEYERALIRQRTKGALAVKRARGERTGEVPFGWRVGADGKHLEPHAAEALIVARAVRLRRRGLSQRAIAAKLAAEGLAARSGKPLSQTQVQRMLARASESFPKPAEAAASGAI